LHQRFEQEARSISRLQHPNICVVHDIGSEDGIDFMVMEYVAGQTLDKLIPPDGLATDLATKYAVQIGDPTIADGILDRLVHNAHRIEMRGESMRKKRNVPQDEKKE
jgi:serine/threonine protein kinase